MTSTDHLARAREFIAIAESADSKREAYKVVADELAAYKKETGATSRNVAGEIGKDQKWVDTLLRWREEDPPHPPFGGEAENAARYQRQANTAMKDPGRRQTALSQLPTEQVEQVIEEAHEVVRDRMRARRSEHDATPQAPTVRDLMGGERFDPAEYWADTLIIRVNRNARELASLIKRGGGLLFGTMPPEEAFDYLHEAERLIAEARAAAQEQVRDRTEV